MDLVLEVLLNDRSLRYSADLRVCAVRGVHEPESAPRARCAVRLCFISLGGCYA